MVPKWSANDIFPELESIITLMISPYDGRWSKSMVGYGKEDDHFVVELTYNYGIGTYKLGNDFRGITIHSKQVLENAKKHGYPVSKENDNNVVKSPDGHKFIIIEEESQGDPVKKVSLGSSDLEKSCKLELCNLGTKIEHESAFGRIAFACPSDQLPGIEKQMKDEEQTILTPLVSLDTPGKATVQVVILADPDGHEICYVGDEAFRELSQMDPKADTLFEEALAADKSDEWFKKKGKTKATA
ncbi:hypothetical protein KUTeg_009659 [Tegillarca granosa]|uniref:Glyoxalase domain-containing protein 4 n=1 Tax=Tegillarca granosa TaxID=220873 RepID=A0ABQ9F6U8_TEGGR|nr:hypothetical protein KUTeg_009659 [Tegillarca granosa]